MQSGIKNAVKMTKGIDAHAITDRSAEPFLIFQELEALLRRVEPMPGVERQSEDDESRPQRYLTGQMVAFFAFARHGKNEQHADKREEDDCREQETAHGPIPPANR